MKLAKLLGESACRCGPLGAVKDAHVPHAQAAQPHRDAVERIVSETGKHGVQFVFLP
jgi:hypothetical protein